MGFPWKRVLSVGSGVAGMFLPGLQSAIQVVEDNLPALKGPDKKAAAVAIAMTLVETAEGAAGKDLVKDVAVQQATSQFVDAYVAAENARVVLLQAIETAKAARA